MNCDISDKIAEMVASGRPAAAYPFSAIKLSKDKKGNVHSGNELVVMFLVQGPLIEKIEDLINANCKRVDEGEQARRN